MAGIFKAPMQNIAVSWFSSGLVIVPIVVFYCVFPLTRTHHFYSNAHRHIFLTLPRKLGLRGRCTLLSACIETKAHHKQQSMYAPQRLVSAQILFRHPSLLFLPVLMGLCTLVPDVTRAFTPLYISTPPASSPSVRHSFASPSARQCQTRRRSPWDPTHDLMRHAMQTVGHDAAVETALPLLFGSWTLEEKRVIQPLWGMKPVRHAGALGIPDGSSSTFEVLLRPKGRLDQPVDSAVRGLDWTLNFKDMYATGRLEFKIVHPPPDKKLIANDQIPHIHYYSGTFCDGLNRVEGFVERYADIEDEKLGPIRKKVRIGKFCLEKKKEEKGEAKDSMVAASLLA